MIFLSLTLCEEWNWVAIGALGQWASAVFTSLAVAVALYSSRTSFRPKIKVKTILNSKRCEVYVYNIGNVTVDIEDVELRLRFNKTPLNIYIENADRRSSSGLLPPAHKIAYKILLDELYHKLQLKKKLGSQTVFIYIIDTKGYRFRAKIKIQVPKTHTPEPESGPISI